MAGGLPSGGPATGSPDPTTGNPGGAGHPGGQPQPYGGGGGGGAGGAGGAPATRVGDTWYSTSNNMVEIGIIKPNNYS